VNEHFKSSLSPPDTGGAAPETAIFSRKIRNFSLATICDEALTQPESNDFTQNKIT
jgi:hypothetical protein